MKVRAIPLYSRDFTIDISSIHPSPHRSGVPKLSVGEKAYLIISADYVGPYYLLHGLIVVY